MIDNMSQTFDLEKQPAEVQNLDGGHLVVVDRESFVSRPTDRFGYYWQLFMVTWPYVVSDLVSFALSSVPLLLFLRWSGLSEDFTKFACCLALSNTFWLWHAGLYPGLGLNPAEELRRISRTLLFSTVVTAISFVAMGPTTWMVGLCFLTFFPFQWLILPVLRGACKSYMLKNAVFIPYLFLGGRSEVLSAYKQMTLFGKSLLQPVGRVVYRHQATSAILQGDDVAVSESDELRFEREAVYCGTFDDLETISRTTRTYWLVEASRSPIHSRLKSALTTIFPQVIFLDPFQSSAFSGSIFCYGAASGVQHKNYLSFTWNRRLKRWMDIIISASALIMLLPLLVTLAIFIKITSQGPAFFSSERIGHGGRRFLAWKYRSMVQNASQVLDEYLEANPSLQEEYHRTHKLKTDPRITWIGKLIRKTSLDELPQLWNVLRGEMSLVGPRPILPDEIGKYLETFEEYVRVVPGITGLWQISGRNSTSYADRLSYVRFYVNNWSLWLDVYILYRTIKTVVLCEGAY